MGIQDRDYYLDKLRELQGYTEKARFRVPLGRPRWIKPTAGAPTALIVASIVVGGILVMALLALVLRH